MIDNVPKFEIERTGNVVTFSLEFSDQFLAIDFYQGMIAGAQQGIVQFQMTTNPDIPEKDLENPPESRKGPPLL